MRLYKITASSENATLPNRFMYVGSKAEGVLERKALMEQGFKRKDISEVEIEVPTDKAGLLKFLNEPAVVF